jgi:hypothetical protein
MRRIFINNSIVTIMAVAAVILVVGWVQARPANAADHHRVYLAANGTNPQSAAVEPHTVPISRDSSLQLDNLTWTTWSDRATGTGVATINLCDPSCATGKMVKIPTSVVLSDPRHVCGRDFFTSMSLTLNGPVPDGLTRTATLPIEPYCG